MKKILLADDNPDLLSALRLLLETRFELKLIVEARDMEHVLAQVEDTHPDWLILDWELPGRPIRERIGVIRTLMPGLKIIITSIHPESKQAALSEGADQFICKCDPPANILEAIRKFYQEEE
jgi:DNA-binding NarL/FixJ family response regulator